MSNKGRLGLIAVALVVAIAAFAIAKPGGDDDDDKPASAPAETATEQPQGHGGDPGPVPPPEPRVERLRVRGGKVVGGMKELEFEKGDVVRLAVTADAPEHVHVHGYDLFEDVGPGQTARFKFEADIEGIFEIELEDSATLIAELRVEP